MTRDEVRRRLEEFLRLLVDEKELRAELGALRFAGVTEEEAKESLSRQRQLLTKLDELHQAEMVPLVSELTDFVTARLAELEQQATPAARK